MENQPQAAANCLAAADRVSVEFAAEQGAPGLARRAAAAAVHRWRLPGLTDAVVLAVSELVTNAVRYGLPPVRLVLSRRSHGLLVEVHDEAHDAPPRLTGRIRDGAESGRELGIVRAVASDSGVEQIPGDGKIVYAVFDLPTGAA